MTEVCSIHGSKRTAQNLVEDGAGGFKCTPGNSCKRKSEEASSDWWSMMPSMASSGQNFKKSKICTRHEAGWCEKGDSCTFAHGQEQLGQSQPQSQNPMEMMMKSMGWDPASLGGQKGKGDGKGGKAKPPKTPSFICSFHFMERQEHEVEDDYAGGFSCKAECPCQVGTGRDLRSQFCTLHKKKRHSESLADDGHGAFRCKEGSECAVSTKDPETKTLQKTQVQCSVHQKMRSLMSCEDDLNGGYKCSAGNECQTGKSGADNTPVQCSVHGKMRGMSNMVEDGQGGYQCSASDACRVGGEGGGKGKAGKDKGCGKSNWMADPAMLSMMAMMMKGDAKGMGGKSDKSGMKSAMKGKGKSSMGGGGEMWAGSKGTGGDTWSGGKGTGGDMWGGSNGGSADTWGASTGGGADAWAGGGSDDSWKPAGGNGSSWNGW